MSVVNILSTGMRGLQSGIERSRSTPTTFGSDIDTQALAERIVAQRQGEIQVKAAADVIAAGSSMLGSLIDLRG